MNDNDSFLDLIKVGTVVYPSSLTFLGVSIESWAVVMSLTVGAFYLIEKAPIVWQRLMQFKQMIKRIRHEG